MEIYSWAYEDTGTSCLLRRQHLNQDCKLYAVENLAMLPGMQQGTWNPAISRVLCHGALFCLQMPYSIFMNKLATANIQLNRKVLSDLAMSEPFSFKALVDQVKRMRG